MWRAAPIALFLLASCRGAAPISPAAGALLNVGMATAVGGARVAQGDCFTICPTGTVCNLKTKTCDALPCHGRCGDDERCDMSGPLDRCVKEPGGLEVTQKHDPDPSSQAPIDLTPPLSSAPPTSPEHPDVPMR